MTVPTSVVTIIPAKVVSTVTTLKPSNLGASSTPSSEPSLKAENSAAAVIIFLSKLLLAPYINKYNSLPMFLNPVCQLTL
jgi:transcription initiation factor TFIID subunit 4